MMIVRIFQGSQKEEINKLNMIDLGSKTKLYFHT
jgi:hypothetical protein